MRALRRRLAMNVRASIGKSMRVSERNGGWTPIKRIEARQMCERGLSNLEISVAVGLSKYTVEKELRGFRNGQKPLNCLMGVKRIPDRVLEDRDQRNEAICHRNEEAVRSGNLTFMLGDPPPGYSALDNRRAKA